MRPPPPEPFAAASHARHDEEALDDPPRQHRFDLRGGFRPAAHGQARDLGGCRRHGPPDHRGRGAGGGRGAGRLHPPLRPPGRGVHRRRPPGRRRGDRGRPRRLPAGGAGGPDLRRRADRGVPCRADPRRPHAHGRPRRHRGLALDRARIGRALRAGRHGELSLLRVDERDPRTRRRRAAHRHGGADARRAIEPARAGRRPSLRGPRSLSRRRGAGGGGPGLRHRAHRTGGQDRRVPATPTSRRPSAGCSARSAST